MTIDYTARFEKAKQEVTEQCLKLFETLYRHSTLPLEFRITMSAVSKGTGEVRETKTLILIPEPITYKTMGTLTGKIKDYEVSAENDGEGHFRVTINGKEYPRLHRNIVEEQLGIPAQKKHSGVPSETLGRTVWRHLTDRYNLLDMTVSYF